MSRSADGNPIIPAQAGIQGPRSAALGPRFRGDERNLCCKLICVDPAQVHEFWPHVASLIKAAMEKGRLSSFADVEHSVRSGRALLWLAWNGETVKAAAVTELGLANGETFCTIVACGGRDRAQWLPLLAGIEAYGRAQGCAAMRIYGRRGWRKLLPEYRTTRVLLEKELTRKLRP
jgi:hypothetical protein